ncbi:MAG: hypothetical protein HYU64_21255 [Armatimonadetes bacterium]|nr:hypothetical protein [Armatimonadota bacterium]
MLLPKGNVVIEDVLMTPADVETMISNLENNGFNGYLKYDIYDSEGYLFFQEGAQIGVVEVANKIPRLVTFEKLDTLIRRKEFTLSTYLVTPSMSRVLSFAYTFRQIYHGLEITKKELKEILSSFEQERYTGFMEFSTQEDSVYVLTENGKIIKDVFTDKFEQILCGADIVEPVLESLAKTGCTVNALAESSDEIERKKRLAEEDLSRTKELVVAPETGLLKGGGNAVKIDEGVFKDWARWGTISLVELETIDGSTETIKAVPKKNLGVKILVPGSLFKKLKLREGDMVNIRPRG